MAFNSFNFEPRQFIPVSTPVVEETSVRCNQLISK